jgi:hypothetical protein
MRRPSRAIIVAFVVLSLFATALLAAPAGMAQEVDPLDAIDQSLDGGSVAVPTDVEAGLEDAIEAGGVPAVLETPNEPAPSPAPAPKPQSDAPPPPPDPGMPPETAPEPAPESQPTDTGEENTVPVAPGGPINLNVDIRVLSPGDNGDVTQDITQDINMPGSTGQVGGGPPAQPLAWTWNWIWVWTTPAADDDVEDVAEEFLGEVLGTSPVDPGQMFADTPLEQLAPIEAGDAGPPTRVDHPPSSRPETAAPERIRPAQSHFVGTTPAFLPTLGGDSDGAAAVVADAAGATDRRKPDRGQAPAPKQAPPALPSNAASSVGGGSSAPFAAAVLGLLCLLAPRALELARSRHRKLSSQLSSSRLERPG